jgi:hypothetical protein
MLKLGIAGFRRYVGEDLACLIEMHCRARFQPPSGELLLDEGESTRLPDIGRPSNRM